jgi:hypothetical protein
MNVPLLARQDQIRLTLQITALFATEPKKLSFWLPGSPPSEASRSPSLTSEVFDGEEPYVDDKEWSEEKGKNIIDADFVMVS